MSIQRVEIISKEEAATERELEIEMMKKRLEFQVESMQRTLDLPFATENITPESMENY